MGYWIHVQHYKLGMVKMLMESFDINAALLARFSEFNPVTLIVKTTFGDVNEQLERVEEDLGIKQGWNANTELGEESRVDLIGHQEALAMTLRDPIEDVDDAARSGLSRWTNFFQSTGKSTNNSNATTRLHTQRANALKNIALVDKNYAQENNLHEAQAQMAAIVAQNRLLQEQLFGSHLCATVDSKNANPDSLSANLLPRRGGQLPHGAAVSMKGAHSQETHDSRKETELQLPSSGLPTDKEVPMEVDEEAVPIRGSGASMSASHPSPAGLILFYVDDMDLVGDTGTGLPLLPHSLPPLVQAPLAQGSGLSLASWHISNHSVLSPEGPANCAASRFSPHTHQNHKSSLPSGNGGSKVGGEEDY